jgi:hypothetical protein
MQITQTITLPGGSPGRVNPFTRGASYRQLVGAITRVLQDQLDPNLDCPAHFRLYPATGVSTLTIGVTAENAAAEALIERAAAVFRITLRACQITADLTRDTILVGNGQPWEEVL